MHEERDTLRHFLMSNVKYRGSHYVRVLDMYARITSVETDKRVLEVESHSVPGPEIFPYHCLPVLITILIQCPIVDESLLYAT